MSYKTENDDIRLLTKTRTEYQDKLNIIFKKYFISYMKDIYTSSLRDFQKQLFKIPSWSDDKINKEFKQFIKYTTRKYNLAEDDLTKILDMIFGLYVKTMNNLFDPVEVRVPAFNLFWYKCLKRISKFLYENPALIKTPSNDNISLGIDESIKYIIHKFIPFKEILNVKSNIIDKYNFNEKYTNTNDNTNDNTNTSQEKYNRQVHKINCSDNISSKLKYINSEDFENEYYHTNSEKEEDVKVCDEKKQIKIPKFLFNKKKNYNNYKLNRQI